MHNYEMKREGLCHKVVNLRKLHGHLLKGISVSFAHVTHKQMIIKHMMDGETFHC